MEDWQLITWILAGLTAVILLGTVSFMIGLWSGSNNADSDSYKDLIKQAKGSLAGIRNDIKHLLGAMPNPVLDSEGPITLNDLGKSVSTTVGAKEWAVETTPSLEDTVTEKRPYEIQEFCRSFVSDVAFTAEQIGRIESCAFDFGINRNLVFDVMMIELRDVLLARGSTLVANENEDS